MTKPSANMTLTPFTPEMEQELLDRETERDAVNGNQEDAPEPDTRRAEPEQRQQQDETADKPAPVPMSPHDAKRMAMADRFKRQDDRPFDGDMTKGENLYGDVAAEELAADPAAPEPGVPEQDRQPEPPAPEKKYTIKVRGKDVQLTEAELLERASKVEAADSYLAESRDLLEQAKQVRSGRAAADPQHPEGENRAQGDEQDRDDHQTDTRRPGIDLKAVVEKIQFGEPEEAAKELAEAIEAVAEKRANEGHVKRLVTNDLAKSQTELKAFREANPELDKDPIASNAIENMIYRIYREEIAKLGVDEAQIPKDPKDLADWHRLYRVHGYEVSKTADILQKAKASFEAWRGVPSKDQAPAPRKDSARVQVNVDRTERRMQIPVQPSRGVAPRRDPAPAQTEQSSRSSAVQEMRRARGQPVH